MGFVYRLRQLWHEVQARPLPHAARADVASLLHQGEQQLFNCLTDSDQAHSYRVMATLRAAGYEQPDLLVAALLHDVGKTRVRLSTWDRMLVVVAQKLLPRRSATWGAGDVAGWQRPFVVKAQHPVWGAEMAAKAGSSALTVELIRRHQDPLPQTAVTQADRLLRSLQWADNQN